MSTIKHSFNLCDISRLDDMSYKEISSWSREKIQWHIEHVSACYIPASYTLAVLSQDRGLRKLRKALTTKRPLERDDVVRLPSGSTGVVVRQPEGYSTVCVVPKGNDFGIWYQVSEVKRIGRVHNRR